MTFKKLTGKIHLWLGLSSGLVVLILGVTGCILAFELEIRSLTESFRNVKVENRDALPPSELKAIAEQHLASKKALGIEYPGKDKAAVAAYYNEKEYELLFMNPYSGEVLKHKNMNRDFFRIVLDGHYYLWLPDDIGQPIAASATLVFLVMMISGLILWWPKNKAAKKQRFTIKWSARWRRKNYDLHNVLGFYMTWVAIFLAITGLVFGFQWFAKSLYWITSGGETMVEHTHPVSDTTKTASFANMADHLWQEHRTGLKENESIGVYFAGIPTDPVEIAVNHQPGTYYNSDYYHYDQYTGKELPATGSYAGSFEDAPLADKIVRMNYDMHVGAILGLPGKILAFFASLIAASLPVTGFYIWLGRKKKKKTAFVKQKTLVAASVA
ncbi:PepSY-associated TM helix domain-containing protein [Agriterribacter sp.]|uniref:PepSY-associated TM helix domain-containing protein n=1 Tax=Agriterribacter sp. TaxID=2821509 RepID=UPI002C6BE98A|nr:PepSY-associated TM helix domain-containing protein [Agriterribacter sp.]HRO48440.1 PepSY-associated TM helix domain-containing protein [Agriterribacter sp.]HRQ19519.1 PepSY-associated TM helix domain-containing protein [Agriterribacter sp.]